MVHTHIAIRMMLLVVFANVFVWLMGVSAFLSQWPEGTGPPVVAGNQTGIGLGFVEVVHNTTAGAINPLKPQYDIRLKSPVAVGGTGGNFITDLSNAIATLGVGALVGIAIITGQVGAISIAAIGGMLVVMNDITNSMTRTLEEVGAPFQFVILIGGLTMAAYIGGMIAFLRGTS